MPSFMLRQIDPDLWRRVKARAALEGRTVRSVLLDLITAYADGAPRPPA